MKANIANFWLHDELKAAVIDSVDPGKWKFIIKNSYELKFEKKKLLYRVTQWKQKKQVRKIYLWNHDILPHLSIHYLALFIACDF